MQATNAATPNLDPDKARQVIDKLQRELEQAQWFASLTTYPEWAMYRDWVVSKIKEQDMANRQIDPFEKPKEVLIHQIFARVLYMIVNEPQEKALLVTKKKNKLDDAKAFLEKITELLKLKESKD